uniref:hypothetical protein n=1 Tax=Alloprevotella sp. TaxID=1872471 RepID=UPI0040251A62
MQSIAKIDRILLKNEMHFIFHIKVVYNKLQFIGLIGGTHPNLGATRPRVGIAMLGLEAPTWQC